MSSIYGWSLLTVTFLLVVLGCGLYWLDLVGWAQLAWILASGTAGGSVVLLIGPKDDSDWPQPIDQAEADRLREEWVRKYGRRLDDDPGAP